MHHPFSKESRCIQCTRIPARVTGVGCLSTHNCTVQGIRCRTPPQGMTFILWCISICGSLLAILELIMSSVIELVVWQAIGIVMYCQLAVTWLTVIHIIRLKVLLCHKSLYPVSVISKLWIKVCAFLRASIAHYGWWMCCHCCWFVLETLGAMALLSLQKRGDEWVSIPQNIVINIFS